VSVTLLFKSLFLKNKEKEINASKHTGRDAARAKKMEYKLCKYDVYIFRTVRRKKRNTVLVAQFELRGGRGAVAGD